MQQRRSQIADGPLAEGEDDPSTHDPEPYDGPKLCAATVHGDGRCGTNRIMGELYCRRHLDRMKQLTAKRLTGQATPKQEPVIQVIPHCSVDGCKKPKHPESTQCERHWTKAKRNNEKYRLRAKQAMNGTGDGSWKDVVLEKLLAQRDLYVAKVGDIDRTITAVKGL